jgi:hypothetical protein
MKATLKSGKPASADAIARQADQGKDVTHFFKGQGRMVQPIQRVNAERFLERRLLSDSL